MAEKERWRVRWDAVSPEKRTPCRRRSVWRLIRLVTCGGIFVLLVAAKLLLPGRMAGVSQKLSEAMTRSVDVQAVFSAVGGLFTKDGTPAEAADEVYRAVFHPEGAETRQTAARTADGAALTELRNWRDAEPLNTIPPAGEDPAPEELETMDLVLYSDEDLPENVSMRQAILGFDHETPVKGVLSSNFGYRDHPLEGRSGFTTAWIWQRIPVRPSPALPMAPLRQ